AVTSRIAARVVRRGVRCRNRPSPGELPASFLPFGIDRGGESHHLERGDRGDLMTDYQDTWDDSKGKASQPKIHYVVVGANEPCVLDTGLLPSIGAVSPALIAMDNALRVGDYLIERLGATTR